MLLLLQILQNADGAIFFLRGGFLFFEAGFVPFGSALVCFNIYFHFISKEYVSTRITALPL